MTKTYCDLCGKEIDKVAITLTIELPEEDDEPAFIPPTMSRGYKEFDICPDCSDRVTDFFKKEPVELAKPIVRCSECKHLYIDGEDEQACNYFETIVTDDDFCSFGERKEQKE